MKTPAIVRDLDAIFANVPLVSTDSHGAFQRLLAATQLPTAGRPGKAIVEERLARIAQQIPRRLAPVTEQMYVPVQPLVRGSYPGSWVTIPTHPVGERLPDRVAPGLVPTAAHRSAWRRAEARQRLTLRERALRHAAALAKALGLPAKDADPGEIAREHALEDFARAVGESYHAHIASLYQSSRATVLYGRGGQGESDNTIYKGHYKGWYAHWQHAGARIDDAQIILENSRGTEKARISLPTDAERARIRCDSAGHTTQDMLLDGDLWAVERHDGIYERYGLQRRKLIRTGYALRCESHPMHGQPYYEHGATLEACRAEFDRKFMLAFTQHTREQADARTTRMARLIARRCGRLAITYADARSVGYCDAGIRQFCARHGLDADGVTTLATLRAIQDTRIQRVIKAAALRVACARLALQA